MAQHVNLDTVNLTGIRWFFESNDTAARVLRTIVQGVIGAIIAWLSTLAPNCPGVVSALLIPIAMAILSPIMGAIGDTLDKEETVGGTD